MPFRVRRRDKGEELRTDKESVFYTLAREIENMLIGFRASLLDIVQKTNQNLNQSQDQDQDQEQPQHQPQHQPLAGSGRLLSPWMPRPILPPPVERRPLPPPVPQRLVPPPVYRKDLNRGVWGKVKDFFFGQDQDRLWRQVEPVPVGESFSEYVTSSDKIYKLVDHILNGTDILQIPRALLKEDTSIESLIDIQIEILKKKMYAQIRTALDKAYRNVTPSSPRTTVPVMDNPVVTKTEPQTDFQKPKIFEPTIEDEPDEEDEPTTEMPGDVELASKPITSPVTSVGIAYSNDRIEDSLSHPVKTDINELKKAREVYGYIRHRIESNEDPFDIIDSLNSKFAKLGLTTVDKLVQATWQSFFDKVYHDNKNGHPLDYDNQLAQKKFNRIDKQGIGVRVKYKPGKDIPKLGTKSKDRGGWIELAGDDEAVIRASHTTKKVQDSKRKSLIPRISRDDIGNAKYLARHIEDIGERMIVAKQFTSDKDIQEIYNRLRQMLIPKAGSTPTDLQKEFQTYFRSKRKREGLAILQNKLRDTAIHVAKELNIPINRIEEQPLEFATKKPPEEVIAKVAGKKVRDIKKEKKKKIKSSPETDLMKHEPEKWKDIPSPAEEKPIAKIEEPETKVEPKIDEPKDSESIEQFWDRVAGGGDNKEPNSGKTEDDVADDFTKKLMDKIKGRKEKDEDKYDLVDPPSLSKEEPEKSDDEEGELKIIPKVDMSNSEKNSAEVGSKTPVISKEPDEEESEEKIAIPNSIKDDIYRMFEEKYEGDKSKPASKKFLAKFMDEVLNDQKVDAFIGGKESRRAAIRNFIWEISRGDRKEKKVPKKKLKGGIKEKTSIPENTGDIPEIVQNNIGEILDKKADSNQYLKMPLNSFIGFMPEILNDDAVKEFIGGDEDKKAAVQKFIWKMARERSMLRESTLQDLVAHYKWALREGIKPSYKKPNLKGLKLNERITFYKDCLRSHSS